MIDTRLTMVSRHWKPRVACRARRPLSQVSVFMGFEHTREYRPSGERSTISSCGSSADRILQQLRCREAPGTPLTAKTKLRPSEERWSHSAIASLYFLILPFFLQVPGESSLCNCPTYARLVGSLGPPQAEKFLPHVTDLPKPEAL